MAVVVIGGHARNIGKTSVVCGLIAAMPERRWTAIKITQCDHAADSGDTGLGDSDAAGHAITISEEHDATAGTDSSRYLAAGARLAYFVRAEQSRLSEVMPRVNALISSADNVILESNSILEFLQPDIYAIVLDPGVADFKASAQRYLERADAILLPVGKVGRLSWSGISPEWIERVPKFLIGSPDYSSAEFVSFVAQRLD